MNFKSLNLEEELKKVKSQKIVMTNSHVIYMFSGKNKKTRESSRRRLVPRSNK